MFFLVTAPLAAQNQCGPIANAYGPFDYWTDRGMIEPVETFHFTADVETLRRGKSGSLGGDIDYTLRAVPNHPRALVAMSKLGEKEQSNRPSGASYSVECYFDRAIRFRPKDGMVRLIYANFLSKHGKASDGLKQLEIAEESGFESGNFFYNLGLAYFDSKNYDKSLRSAHRAYELGFDLPGLKNKLQKAGKWRDAPSVPAVAREGARTEGDAAGSDESKSATGADPARPKVQ